MSDKVQRFTQYYDDVVLDDNGELVSFGDYELLCARTEELEEKLQQAVHIVDDKDERIESLEQALAKASLRTQELKKELSLVEEELFYPDKHGYAIITFDQIDAAWERLMYYKNSKEFKDQLIWQCIGTILEPFNIVACEECGGSGVVREHERGYEDGVEDTCPSCNGHGWEIK